MSLKLDKISKIYTIAGQKTTVIESVNLELNSGTILSITGKSGSGKTTLLNIISGITRPTTGSIYINNKKIHNTIDVLAARRRNREMGFIFQTFRLLPGETVLSNVLLPARIRGRLKAETREYASDLLSRLLIYKYRKSKIDVLSGGQKQRVAIARALINNPGIILADEPTANLDKKTSIDIFNILEDLKNEGKAVLIITHKEYMHQRSDRVYNLEKGVLKELL